MIVYTLPFIEQYTIRVVLVIRLVITERELAFFGLLGVLFWLKRKLRHSN